jgi:hypothetical protein
MEGWMTVGEAALVVVGFVGFSVNAALMRRARRVHRWIREAGGIKAARLAAAHIWRATLGIVGSLGALIVGVLAAATPGRFAGQGLGFGIAIFAGVCGFAAIVASWILDLRGRLDAHRGLVHELVVERDIGVQA